MVVREEAVALEEEDMPDEAAVWEEEEVVQEVPLWEAAMRDKAVPMDMLDVEVWEEEDMPNEEPAVQEAMLRDEAVLVLEGGSVRAAVQEEEDVPDEEVVAMWDEVVHAWEEETKDVLNEVVLCQLGVTGLPITCQHFTQCGVTKYPGSLSRNAIAGVAAGSVRLCWL